MTENIHFMPSLMRGMADALGVDLEAMVRAGALALPELQEMAARCRECAHPGDCILWLTECERPAADTPGFCRNREEFTALVAHVHAAVARPETVG